MWKHGGGLFVLSPECLLTGSNVFALDFGSRKVQPVDTQL